LKISFRKGRVVGRMKVVKKEKKKVGRPKGKVTRVVI
jgi:hypothetical protein